MIRRMCYFEESLRLQALMEATPTAFGKHLAALRKMRGWSQERLALECGMARSYLGGVERGQRNLSLKNLVKLASALNISLPVLMNFTIDDEVVVSGIAALTASKDAETRSAQRKSSTYEQDIQKTKSARKHAPAALHEADSAYDRDE